MSDPRLDRVYVLKNWEIDLSSRELRLNGAPVPLGGRAIEILSILAGTAGETIGKYDLIDRVWPGNIITENTLQFHISAARKALGHDRAMLQTVFGRGYRLMGKWTTRGDASVDAGHPNKRAPGTNYPLVNNLPAAVSKLIGRATAIRDLEDCLSAYRVVTLTGLGGVGKTSLAIEVARRRSLTAREDTVLVELASVSDPGLVPTAVAGSLGQRLGTVRLDARAVGQSIGHRELLLVLDNCEHLIDAAAELAETLVRLCPQVSILATSREPLRIAGEYTYRLPPLDVPASDSSDPLQHGAVELFVTRAGDYSRFFKGDDLLSIVSICQRLDGIPLAIEFAAARAATLGVQHLASRLSDRFELLGGTRRTALPRHQTLRATLDWSYELLSQAEQRLLRNLAIFSGGFSFEAAEAMARAIDIQNLEETISNLVSKSFLTLIPSRKAARWRLLETIRVYALEKLAENGEMLRAARLHAEYFLLLFSPSDDESLVTIDNVAQYASEIDNVRAALDWAFSGEGDKAIGVTLVSAYAPVWLDLTLIAECRDRVDQAKGNLIAASNLPGSLKAQLLTILGLVHTYAGVPTDKTRESLREALEISERLGDQEAQLQALYAFWTDRFFFGDLHGSHDLAERMARIALSTQNSADLWVADRLLATTNHYRGNQVQALQYFEAAFNREPETRDRRRAMWFHHGGLVLPRSRMARTLWMRGAAGRALELAEECLEEARRIDRKGTMCLALAEALCPINIFAGDLSKAANYIAMLNELAHNSISARYAHSLHATLLIRSGDAERGLKKLRSALDEFGTAEPLDDAAFITHFSTPHGSGFATYYVAALVALGDFIEADSAIDSALARGRRDGILWHVPELLRMKGDLLIHRFGEQSYSGAERFFSEAYDLAEEQGAVFWQLRAAISIAKLRIKEDRSIEARSILAPLCELLGDEVEFSDLRTARELVASLGAKP